MDCRHRNYLDHAPKQRFVVVLNLRLVVLAGALAAVTIAAVPGAARAEGLFDFFFGGAHRPTPPPSASAYADPSPSSARGSLPHQGARQSSGSGRAIGFCVRLCDGRHFPLVRMTNATPVETCRAMCPASQTEVFFGGRIDHAAAHDGARYADLANAFAYRDHTVPNCTCNGKDALGLVPLNMANDPTLRPGDIVATKDGFVAYNGRRGEAAFTPADPAVVGAELSHAAAPSRPSRRHERPLEVEPPVADDPGTILPAPTARYRQDPPPVADLRGQTDR